MLVSIDVGGRDGMDVGSWSSAHESGKAQGQADEEKVGEALHDGGQKVIERFSLLWLWAKEVVVRKWKVFAGDLRLYS